MRTRKAASVLTAALALVLAGCSSGTSNDTASVTAAPPAGSETAPAGTGGGPTGGVGPGESSAPTATDHPAIDPNACTATELRLTAGRSEGAAGSVMIPLVFTNTGGRTCTLDGFPGVSYVTGQGGTQVGAAATRAGAGSGPVPLAPGASATANVRAVQVLNYPSQQCVPGAVGGLRVFPPNAYDSLYLPHSGTGCTQPGVHQLEVTAVVPG
ncbi:DUF4232 domain-containing protein [Rhodococcus sp. NPDC127528]|uniref:DUF4232 domain-containing protein n=1 Tax=unclassified Rhodococcus (in: high G+C Gram-positive bacteria) TaxID=192944 RepID=UPI0036318975